LRAKPLDPSKVLDAAADVFLARGEWRISAVDLLAALADAGIVISARELAACMRDLGRPIAETLRMPDGRDVKGYRRENVVIDDPFLDDRDIAALVAYRRQARVVHLTAEAITRINGRIRSDGACRGGEAPIFTPTEDENCRRCAEPDVHDRRSRFCPACARKSARDADFRAPAG